MDILKLFLLILLCSCAKLSYITKQGYGQLAIELKGKDNEDVLKDDKVSMDHKEKIKKIIEYKKYFYKYFNEKPNAIYSETTFLDRDAVSYLVIASKYYEIKAKRTSFPIVGSFPYLGFYSLEDAKNYAKDLESKGHFTYLRKVYAYSTLNKLFFKDNILSSFFIYDEKQLAELIFHELIHTIFFIEDNISFNESLADYIAEEMTIEYLKISKEDHKKSILNKRNYQSLAEKMTELVSTYKQKLKNNPPKSKGEALLMMSLFLKNELVPQMEKICKNRDIKNCWPAKRKWNNASFTAFLTYNKKKNLIKKIKGDMSIREFISYLKIKKKEYEQTDTNDFSKLLLK